MDDRCDNCRPSILVDALSAEVKNLKEEINELKTTTTINKEQTKMVFKMLTEIKESIAKIADKMDFIESKPARNWEELIKVIIGVLGAAAVTYFITKK
jgi:lipopolysaccharide biosynthesis regulator YciM